MAKLIIKLLLIFIFGFISCSSEDEPNIESEPEMENPLDKLECPVLWSPDSTLTLASVDKGCYSINFTFGGNRWSFEDSINGIKSESCYHEILINEQVIDAGECNEVSNTAINGLSSFGPFAELTMIVLGEPICNGDTLETYDTLRSKMAIAGTDIYFDICE
jgi:hypothetical protein